LIGVWIAKRQSRINLDAQSEQITIRAKEAALEAQKIPTALLQGELTKRENELAELRSQDREERSQYLTTLTKFGNTMDEMATDLRSLREEERARASKVYGRVDEVDNRLLVIETKLGMDPAPKKREIANEPV